jgi:hypothetical protein
MFNRILKALIGAALVPASVSFGISLFDEIGTIQILENTQGYFLYGIGAYAFMHLIIFKPVYLYVLGHELMHVLATWLCAGKIRSFHISSKGGSVKASKSNFFIALAPYFFPTYTIVAAIIFGLISVIRDMSSYINIFIFVLGFTLAFHFVMTVEMLKKKQPDVVKTGYIFSGNLIFLINIVILSLILAAIFDGPNFIVFIESSLDKTREIYLLLFRELF